MDRSHQHALVARLDAVRRDCVCSESEAADAAHQSRVCLIIRDQVGLGLGC